METDKYKNKVLAEELSDKLDDKKNIGFYYTLATKYSHDFLREICYWVSDYPNPQSKGKLFTWKLKNELARKSLSKNDISEDGQKAYINIKSRFNLSMNRKRA